MPQVTKPIILDDTGQAIVGKLQSIAEAIGIDAVRFTEQVLTEVQKAQARQNIGALGEGAIPTKVSDLTNDSGFQTASQVSTAVAAETTRATAKENAIEGTTDKVVLNGMTASEDGSTVSLSLSKINIKTGATTSVDVPLPVVDANGAGVLNPQTYQTIISNQTLINAIIGASVAVSGLAAEPTQQQVTTAWLTASGEDELVNGARLFDVTNTKVWTYYTNPELWYAVEAEGGVTVAQWTNSALGTIKGVADNAGHTNDGKLTAETDGTGSVLGWDRLVAKVQTIEGTIPTVPTIATTISSESVNTETAGAKAVYDAVNPHIGTSVPTGGLLPNVLYRLGTLTSDIEITLATPAVSTIENTYKFTFNTDATLVGVTFPSVTKWQGNCLQNGIPVLAASKHYEVSIEGGYGIIIEF